MTDSREGTDQVGHGEASLGEAQSSNPPEDPEMIRDDEEQEADAPDRE